MGPARSRDPTPQAKALLVLRFARARFPRVFSRFFEFSCCRFEISIRRPEAYFAQRRADRDSCFCALEHPPGMGVQRRWSPRPTHRVKPRIGHALSDRLAPMCSAIVETTKPMIGLIDELPAVAVEVLLDHD
jgi:hypothetical protein